MSIPNYKNIKNIKKILVFPFITQQFPFLATNSQELELELEMIFCQLGTGIVIESPRIGIEELELGWN